MFCSLKMINPVSFSFLLLNFTLKGGQLAIDCHFFPHFGILERFSEFF